MRAARLMMPSTPDDFAFLHQDRTDHRIGRSLAIGTLCEEQSSLHIGLIVGFPHGSGAIS
jgi:hypothetical protein